MWSSNLLIASLQKLNREKRERQPNWTETEKQLLLSLTGMYKTILENKGSDTMTIKRKSEAWDQIALKMKSAGFNRSKERLKQQLGRIRAAEAKRVKDAVERNLTNEQINILNRSNSSIEENNSTIKAYLNENQIDNSLDHAGSSSTPLFLQEHQYIKSEETASFNENDCFEQETRLNLSTFDKANVNYTIMASSKDNENKETPKILLDSMHFKLQSVQSLAKINMGNGTKEDGICAADVTSSISCSNESSNIKSSTTSFDSNRNNNSGNDENDPCSSFANKCQKQQRRKCKLRLRSNRMRTSFNRDKSLRQLYTYRIAFERERLCSLRLQQKRDRILYRKDIEIQNLKLQILRNLTNQNRDTNSINF